VTQSPNYSPPPERAPTSAPSARKLSALQVACRVLERVEAGAYATLALSGELERAHLPATARALCTELVYGTLRMQLRLDRALLAYAPRGLGRLDDPTRTLLRLGAYQLLFMRTPPHAAVNQTVELLTRLRGRGLGGFANALLRHLHRDGEPALPPVLPETPLAACAEALAVRWALPRWLVQDALQRFGLAEAEAFLASLSTAAPTWLRLNSLRGGREAARRALRAELSQQPGNGEVRFHEVLPEAALLTAGHPFAGSAYAAGWFTAQDLGAQLVARLLLADSERGPLELPEGALLDACAGVGGKATHLGALTANQRDIDAADRSPRKLELCADHAHRLGCQRIRTVLADLSCSDAPLRRHYAAVLLDAPCSGLGVLRRHPEARHRIGQKDVRELAALQQKLLHALCQRVAPGGVLVYSVCSYLDEEGPAQLGQFLRAHDEFQPLPPARTAPFNTAEHGLPTFIDWEQQGALRTWPHRHDADGFYALRLQRRR
jgi:16S rRNA (cytosine967-C5)-methyltransferase